MLCRSTWLLWLFLTTVAIPAAAHPGHGTPGSEASPVHYATEPFHALPLVAGVVVAAASVAWIARRKVSHRRV